MKFKSFFLCLVFFPMFLSVACSSGSNSKPQRPLTKQERIALYKRLKLPGYTDNKTRPLTQQQIDQLPEKEQAAYLAKIQKEKEARDRAISHLNKWEKKAVDLYYLSESDKGADNYMDYMQKHIHFKKHTATTQNKGGEK